MTNIDDVYNDRNNIILMAAKLAAEAGYPVSLMHDKEAPDWPVVAIRLPTGQVSWHVPKWMITESLEGIPVGAMEWDGHTNDDKAARIREYTKDWLKAASNPHQPFEDIRLLTIDGHHVADVEVPAFRPQSEIIVWGSRTFVRRPNGEYREGMIYYVAKTNT